MNPQESAPTPTPRTRDARHRYWNGGAWSREFAKFTEGLELELAASQRRVAELTGAEEACRALFEMLDRTEESDSGNVFHPHYISTCRAMEAEELARRVKAARNALLPAPADHQQSTQQ